MERVIYQYMTLARDTRRQARGCCNKNLVGCNLTFFYFKNSLLYFWLCWVFVAARRLSLVVASRGYSLVAWATLQCVGVSLQWLLLLRSSSSRARLSSYGALPQLPQGMWNFPCTGRQIPNCWITSEALGYTFIIKGKVRRRRRPPSSSFFESPIINSSYMLGRGVFDPAWPHQDCHGTMEILFQASVQ